MARRPVRAHPRVRSTRLATADQTAAKYSQDASARLGHRLRQRVAGNNDRRRSRISAAGRASVEAASYCPFHQLRAGAGSDRRFENRWTRSHIGSSLVARAACARTESDTRPAMGTRRYCRVSTRRRGSVFEAMGNLRKQSSRSGRRTADSRRDASRPSRKWQGRRHARRSTVERIPGRHASCQCHRETGQRCRRRKNNTRLVMTAWSLRRSALGQRRSTSCSPTTFRHPVVRVPITIERSGAAYIDVFCGPGRLLIRDTTDYIDGSPVAAFKQGRASPAPFSSIEISDMDAERLECCAYAAEKSKGTCRGDAGPGL